MKQTMRRFGLMEKLLLEHSVVCGHLASRLAGGVDLDRDDAFTAGLMHDIGETALANSHHDEYEQIVQRVYNENVGFCEAERELFGFDHAELGVAVAMNWSLPDVLLTVIGQHHERCRGAGSSAVPRGRRRRKGNAQPGRPTVLAAV